jgi:hypothetical protein
MASGSWEEGYDVPGQRFGKIFANLTFFHSSVSHITSRHWAADSDQIGWDTGSSRWM